MNLARRRQEFENGRNRREAILQSIETTFITCAKESGFSYVAIYRGYWTAYLVAGNRLL